MELLTILWILGYVLLLAAGIYRFFIWHFDYFIEQGISGPTPVPVFGTWWGIWKRKCHEVELERYRKYGQIYGTFDGRTPNTVIGDPAILRKILIKDFENFPTRRYFDNNNKYMASMLSNMKGQTWKDTRCALSPAFTSGKIKLMTGLMGEVAVEMVKVLQQTVDSGVRKVNLRSITVGYALDVIASCGFGTRTDCLENAKSPFLINAANVFAHSAFSKPYFAVLICYSKLWKLLPKSVFDVFNFFIKLASKMVDQRKKELNSNRNGPKRNDFLDIILENNASSETPVIKNDVVIIAQVLQFLVAGFEATATTISNVLNSLALDQEIQDKLRAEIREAIKKHGNISYESVSELPYLQQCISETLRLFPPGLKVERLCARTTFYEGAKIQKGTMVTIPIYAIHHDPKIYKNPETFDPERFSPEEKNRRDPMTYLPFGEGPRNCIASRFALEQVKTAICHILNEFRVFRVFETADSPNFSAGAFPILHAGKIIVGIEKLPIEKEQEEKVKPLDMKQNTAETYI